MSIVSDSAFRDQPKASHPSGDRVSADRAPADWTAAMPVFQPGWVWLAGAGPGDPGLITLQVLHGLQRADVIFYDALVGDGVLDFAPAATRRIFVGKRGGVASPRQPEINRQLIEAARSGARVLRLKGGDPFVFGRGAEEASGLFEAGVPFRVLPGVTSGIGGLAYAGIPVTHRDHNHAVTFITAHDQSGDIARALDWPALARGAPVLVIYMGFRLLGPIAERLLAAGRPADEPVAVVSKATTAEQRTLVTTLGACVAETEAAGIESPVLIVVGPVVRARPLLNWFEALTPPQAALKSA